MKLIFDDPEFSFQLLRIVGTAPEKGSDIGECVSTAHRVIEGDFDSWYFEWLRTAERIDALGREYAAAKRWVSAREAYLRASNYYRAAGFFLSGRLDNPEVMRTSEKSRSTFKKACELFPTPVENVEIPYENTTLPGYFFQVDDRPEKRPTMIFNTGFDGTAEELYFDLAGALRRGYNCLSFDGPGQGSVIREQKIPFRPDWEKVITPVVDFLLDKTQVDPERLGILGLSLGGYLAPRAAAFEHRLSVCVADGGVFDMLEGATSKWTNNPGQLKAGAIEYPEAFDEQSEDSAERSTEFRWALSHGEWVFGVNKPHEFILKMSEYSLRDTAQKIVCPTLVCDSENDSSFPGQAEKLYQALTCPKAFQRFTKNEGAGEHCQAGAILLRDEQIFNWLDSILTPDTISKAA